MSMITRTIKSTVAITKCVDLNTMEIVDKTFTMGNVKPEKVAKILNNMLKDSDLKVVKIIEILSDTAKFKMDETTFIKNAERVD